MLSPSAHITSHDNHFEDGCASLLLLTPRTISAGSSSFLRGGVSFSPLTVAGTEGSGGVIGNDSEVLTMSSSTLGGAKIADTLL